MDSWPTELVRFLEVNFKVFVGWCCISEHRSSNYEFENTLSEIQGILNKYSLIGYHCTKLTRTEISGISKYGMRLQNGKTLTERLKKLEVEDTITKKVAEALNAKNKSDADNRANMIWFCFYIPLGEDDGMDRFFKSWGGEALYNSHRDSSALGEVIKCIGIPCLIRAIVPMRSIPISSLPWKEIIGKFLESKGFKLDHALDSQGYSTEPIPPENIIEILENPTETFIKLNDCKKN